MARDLDNSNSKGRSVPYILAAIILAIIMIINMLLVHHLYSRTTAITASSSRVGAGSSAMVSHLNEIK